MSLHLDQVETPVGVVDLARAQANAEKVVQYATEHGIAWRPHVKTHKSLEIARMQLAAGARGLTVATPHEAEVMATVCDDLILAYPVLGASKVRRVVALLDRVDLKVALDSSEALGPLAAAAVAADREVGILVELDVGLRRVGLPGAAEVVALAQQVAATSGARFEGILFYAGHIRGVGADQDEAMRALSAELDAVVGALGAAGLPPGIVSGGTTPSLWRSHELPALTEIRSGTCIYYDRAGVTQGVATPDDWAYTVLATVVSTAVDGRAAIDAGSKALTAEVRGDGGLGEVWGRPEVRVVAMSEEHGMLDLSHTEWRPEVGERVRIVPNHVCVSVNLQDRVIGIEADGSTRAIALEGRGRGPWSPSGTP